MATNENDIEAILQQAPEGIDRADVVRLYEKYEGKSLDILTELWNLPNDPVKNTSCDERKWNEIRDICDYMNEEYDRLMQKARRQHHNITSI